MARRARKRFGQNFLVAQPIIDRIIDSIAIRPTDSLLEIGPGRGALTPHLAQRSESFKAIELDRDLVAELYRRYPTLDVIEGDVLRQPPELFQNRRVIGNLPYEISTPLLTKLIEIPQIQDMHFMLQKEVGMRLAANPGTKEYGRLTVNVQLRCEVEKLIDVEPTAFRPEPKVQSTFVRIQPRNIEQAGMDYQKFDLVVRSAFSQRRKTIRNSLKELAIPWDDTNVDPGKRADQVLLDDYIALSKIALKQ